MEVVQRMARAKRARRAALLLCSLRREESAWINEEGEAEGAEGEGARWGDLRGR